MKQIKVVICDLDGTLYQDRAYYKRFIAHMLRGSAYEVDTVRIQEKADAIVEGRDAMKLGHFYDSSNAVAGLALEERLAIPFIENKAGHFDDYMDRKYRFVGDGWNLVFMMADRLEIPREAVDVAFKKVREEMLMADYAIEVNRELIDVLGELKGQLEGIYLLTNTPEPEAVDFVSYMGLEDKFTRIHYGADKPFGLMTYLPEILEAHGITGREVLAIGDHGYNDLYPVHAIGGKTILATPYEVSDQVPWSMRVQSLEALKNELEALV
ncbi:MAG: HAD family hydrolase [Cellulosilyticaceae bacterium]